MASVFDSFDQLVEILCGMRFNVIVNGSYILVAHHHWMNKKLLMAKGTTQVENGSKTQQEHIEIN